MPRGKIATKERVSNRTALSVRSKKMGELHAYYEQLCPSCNTWKPRFYGSKMASGRPSSFTACKECRNAQAESFWERAV
jgi:hypothetical protein